MLLIPIGHEDLSVRRLPWVTIAVAAICTLLQVRSCALDRELQPGRAGTIAELQMLLTAVAQDCLQRRDCPLHQGDASQMLVEGLEDRTLGSPGQQARFAVLKLELMEDLQRGPTKALGLSPDSITPLALLTHPFVHGGFAHLLWNMLFLYVVGVTIEERWGRLRFLLFYLLGGAAAGLAYCALHPDSSIPLVGASGAIAAAMGAFVVLSGQSKIRFFYLFFLIRAGTIAAPAWVVLPLWFLAQLFSISAEVRGEDNVGYSAHVGGFVFGLAAAFVIRFAGFDKRFQEDMNVATGGWVEDALLKEARMLVDRGEERSAQIKLSQYLAKAPRDLQARELAFDLAMRSQNLNQIQRHAGALFPVWAKSSPRTVLQSFDRILELAQEGPIEDAVLDPVLTAANSVNDLEAAQLVLRQLFRHQPRSPLLPRSMWVVAEIHRLNGRADLQSGMLQRLLRDHPQSPWSERARNISAQR